MRSEELGMGDRGQRRGRERFFSCFLSTMLYIFLLVTAKGLSYFYLLPHTLETVQKYSFSRSYTSQID